MNTKGKTLLVLALVIGTIVAPVAALTVFADPIRDQQRTRDQDCGQNCVPSVDCEPNEYGYDHDYNHDYNHNHDYDKCDCDDCPCDGKYKPF